jgi:predicted nucleic acid-binding protein
VPAPVVVELDWLSASRGLPGMRDAFLASVDDASILVEELMTSDYARIRQLCRRYDDLPLGVVDASVITVAERLAERKLVTLDRRHFSIVRPRHTRAFTLLPEAG